MAFSYISVYLFNGWLKRKTARLFITASAFILLPYIALVECYREGNLALHGWVVGKGRGIIITFLDK